MFTLTVFHAAGGHRVEEDLSVIPALLEDPQVTVWLDLVEPVEHEASLLHEVFRFHPLAIEDALQDYGHPKLDTYEDHLFLVLHAINLGSVDLRATAEIATIELDIFVGARLIVTHHPLGLRTTEALHAELAQAPKARVWSATRLLHRLIDRLVDNYIPSIDALGEALEALEDEVLHRASPEHLDRILSAKKSVLRLRRVIAHQRSILESLARGTRALIAADELAFYRDVHDHFVYVADQIESYRETVQSVMDAYHSVAANRMNEIMKVLTQISTVMLPLTFIAGVYGMNFDNMPELHWPLGYPFAVGLMVATALGMVLYFRSRRLL